MTNWQVLREFIDGVIIEERARLESTHIPENVRFLKISMVESISTLRSIQAKMIELDGAENSRLLQFAADAFVPSHQD